MCVYAHVCDAHAIIDLTATSGAVGAVQHVSETMPSYLWTVFSYIPKQRENALLLNIQVMKCQQNTCFAGISGAY